MKSAGELLRQVERPRVAVRLEQHVDAPEAAEPRGIQGGADFGGMMSVIVNDRDAAFFAAHLEAPLHALKCRQGSTDGLGLHFQLHGHHHRRRGVEHVVPPGDRQVELAQIAGAPAQAEIARE